MINPLVSIVTPCYNGEFKIRVFLDSLLNQTYRNIELIIVNDGSTDNTEEVIFSYKDYLTEKGIKFIYIKQDNLGVDVALNNGLKYFTGEYLMWPDSDDILEPTNIEEMVNFLENNYDCGLVHCNAYIVDDIDNNIILQLWDREYSDDKFSNFIEVLLWRNILASGAWMVRGSDFLTVRPNRELEIIKEGQNWQMLLPMVYNYKIGKIDKFLFKYVKWKSSHSRMHRTRLQIIERVKNFANGRISIMDNMSMDFVHKDYCYELVKDDMNCTLFDIAYENYCMVDAIKCYRNTISSKKKSKMKKRLIKLRWKLFLLKIKKIIC